MRKVWAFGCAGMAVDAWIWIKAGDPVMVAACVFVAVLCLVALCTEKKQGTK